MSKDLFKNISFEEQIPGPPGPQGIQGEKGEKGDRGERGEKGEQGLSGLDGLDGKDGLDGINGKDGKDAEIDLELINDIDEVITEKVSVFDIRIKDIERISKENQLPVTTSFFNGIRAKNLNIIGATASQSGDTVNVTISNSSGGGSGFQIPLTGGLTGTNTWTTAPNVLVIDGVPRQKTQTDGTIMWTGTTTTVLTANCPLPTFDIFGL